MLAPYLALDGAEIASPGVTTGAGAIGQGVRVRQWHSMSQSQMP